MSSTDVVPAPPVVATQGEETPRKAPSASDSASAPPTHHTVTSLMQELHAKEQHLEELQCRAAEAEAALAAKKDLLNVIRANNPISKEELVEVRGTIETQDKIIAALERDNERLLTENRALSAKMRDLEKASAETEARTGIRASQTSPAKGAPAVVGFGNNEGATEKMHMLTIERYQTTETELRLEVDALKKSKRDLERRLSEIDGNRVEQKELELRRLKVSMQRQQESNDSEMNDMLRKVAWYVEHQEFNAAQEDLIKEQQQTIHKLRARGIELEEELKIATGSTKITSRGKGGDEKDRIIKQLHKQIFELEEVIRTRNPNSIPEILRACRPSAREERTIRELQETIVRLQKQLGEQEENSQKAIDRLRIDTDGLRANYQKRLEKMEEEMKLKLLSAQTRKTKELEKTLADTRRFYTTKIKEQDEYIVGLRRGLAPKQQQQGTAQRPPGRQQQHSDVSRTTAGGEKHDVDASAQKTPPPAKRGGPDLPPHPGTPPQHQHTSAAVDSVFAGRLLQENAHLRETIAAMEQRMMQQQMQYQSGPQLSSVDIVGQHVAQLQHELAVTRRLLQEAQEASRQGMMDSEERVYRLRSAHAKEVAALKEEHREATEVLRRKHYNELAQKDESSRMFDVLGSITVGGNLSTTQVRSYLEAVASRLRSIENQNKLREVQLRQSLEQVQKAADYELAVEKQKMELVVRQKNCEIDAFRLQLDALLQDLAQLRSTEGDG